MVFAEAPSAKARYLRFEGEKQSAPYNYPPMRQKSLKPKENAIFGGVSVLGSLNGYRIQRQNALILGNFAILATFRAEALQVLASVEKVA